MAESIATTRLDLVLLGPAFLAGCLTGQRPNLGFADPVGFLVGADDVIRLRLAQLEADPTVGSWLLRALVLRETRIAIGFAGFHAAPTDGVAELGYEVHPQFRRQGYATEASAGLIAWAAQQGVRRIRASVAPDNHASLALLAGQGFIHIGSQIDPDDGLELVLEKPIEPSRIG